MVEINTTPAMSQSWSRTVVFSSMGKTETTEVERSRGVERGREVERRREGGRESCKKSR